MAKLELHPDFKDFLRLLNSHGVKYLLVGGYAVGFHGYPRATADMDIWIATDDDNAEKTAAAIREFGMPPDKVNKEMFLAKNKVIRMGNPPVRIEIITSASGVSFEDCYSRAETVTVEDISLRLISLADLKKNKKASGRHKDLEDITHLP